MLDGEWMMDIWSISMVCITMNWRRLTITSNILAWAWTAGFDPGRGRRSGSIPLLEWAAHRMWAGAGVWWDFIAPFCDRYTFTWFSYFRMKKISYLFIWKKPQDIAALACAIPQMWHEGRSNMASTAVLMPLRAAICRMRVAAATNLWVLTLMSADVWCMHFQQVFEGWHALSQTHSIWSLDYLVKADSRVWLHSL